MPLILLVDDSPVAGHLLSRRLAEEGFSVQLASSMREARLVDVGNLGCGIIDLQLADGDGTDLAYVLLGRRRALPIAFFTAGGSPALVQSARACGPVFLKPEVAPVLAWVKKALRPSYPPPTK